MDLVLFENKMPDLYSQIIENERKRHKIKQLEPKELASIVLKSVQMVHKIKNLGTPTEISLSEFCGYVQKFLLEKYSYINEFDIYKAAELGALGELKEENDSFKPSPELFINWIKRYVKRIRSEAIAKHNQEVEKAQKKADEAYHKNGNLRLITNICSFYDKFGSDTIPIKVIACYFRHLRDLGFIKLSPEQYREIELKGYAKYKIMEQDATIFGKYALATPQDLMQEIALMEAFKQWHKECKQLIVENETIKLV